MAVNVNVQIGCVRNWRHYPDPPAVGLLRDAFDVRVWRGVCGSCIEEFEADPDPVAHDVVYFDPTRQRRPEPDRPTAYNGPPTVGAWPDYPDRP